MDRRRVILTHYDLDGVGSYILMNKFIKPIEKKICCGYGKLTEKINNDELSGFDSCIITDMSLTPELFKKISSEYSNRFLYIDHHATTKEALKVENNCQVHFDNNFSATGIIFRDFNKYLRNFEGISKFVFSVDSYDMWRFKTHPESFNIGYDLNILFWKYGFYDFSDRFSSNFSLDFSNDEKKWISDHKIERDVSIKESYRENIGNNTLVVVNADERYINDYSLIYNDIDIFFIMYKNSVGMSRVSVRSKIDPKILNIGGILNSVVSSFKCVLSSGGHHQTGGIDFIKDTEFDDMLDVIEGINDIIEIQLGYKTIPDVPF